MDGNKSDPNNQQFISFGSFSPVHTSGDQALLDIDIPIQQSTNNLSSQPSLSANNNLQDTPEQNTDSSPSFWTIEYYQKYFNVTTTDVLERIKRSTIPFGTDGYLLSYIRPNPDLYGPFWICITLIIAIAISGNIANYFQTAPSGKFHWKYDFHMVTIAATWVFLYSWLLPFAIWGALKWTNNSQHNNSQDELIQSNNSLGLLEIICVYGYSLAIYVPVALLWAIQKSWFQWSLVIFAVCISGGILLRSLMSGIFGKHKIIYAVVILSMHILLATGIMLYFFYNTTEEIIPVTIPPTVKLPEVIPTTVKNNAIPMNNVTV